MKVNSSTPPKSPDDFTSPDDDNRSNFLASPPTPPYKIIDISQVTGQSKEEFAFTVEKHQYKFLWTYAANAILGLWLISSPFLFDYKSQSLAISDTVAGALVILFESLSFSPRRSVVRWCTPVVAFWLLMAPLIFWSPTPTVFLMDTLIACLVISFSILVPGVPGKGGVDLPGPDQPPSWTYNPSSWIRRWLGIALALLGFLISRYLAAHQLGYIEHAWDPFFGNGSDKVTGSALSKSFPISDAGLGSVAYILETMAGFMGDRARWRTAPFIAVMFALLVLPLGATSIILVVMQPVVVGAWCGLCLVSAVALITSVPLAVHEAVAVGQFLVEARAQGKNLWKIFWFGGSITGGGNTDPDRMRFNLAQRYVASIQGVTVPWTLALQLAIGTWLMARPDLISSSTAAANLDHIVGALAVTVAAVATAEVTRIVRYLNILFAALLIVASFVLALGTPAVCASDCFCSLVLILTSLPRGAIAEKYGNWDRFVR